MILLFAIFSYDTVFLYYPVTHYAMLLWRII